MLGLHYITPPEWADQVLQQPADLLLDHVFAEKKAAAMALHMLRVFGKKYPVLKPLMTDLANEEYEHADRVEKILLDYPRPQSPKGGNPYAHGLRKLWQVTGRDSFLDMLLVSGLIESRSAERFRVLADHARGTSLGNFYEDLYAAEVNHYLLFTNLGVDFYGEELTQKRLNEMRAFEANLIKSLPPGPRIHSGVAQK
jgi:tRNA 2-(methylsulfanyl)-N6-isopentenyladenosine37 hydroxylase